MSLLKSLKFRLTLSVIITVCTVITVGMIIEYQRAYQERLEVLRGSLEEQAHAVRLAYSQIKGKEEFARYVNEFCAQINGYISPGHHILVLNDQGQIIASTRHHSGKETEETLLTADPTEKILYQGKHRLAQVDERSSNTRPGAVEEAEPYLERTHMGCDPSGETHRLFGRSHVEGDYHRTYHGSAAPINSLRELTP